MIIAPSNPSPFTGLPKAQGLYGPGQEHDACGVGMICRLDGQKSHEMIADGLTILRNLMHRGAYGCDASTGDGAGILIQMPHAFFEQAADGIRLPRRASMAAV